MAVQSLSIRRLNNLLLPIVSGDTLATADLWHAVRMAHIATTEIEDPAKKMVAWALMKTLEYICQRYDNHPMDVEVSDILLPELRKIVNRSLGFMSAPVSNAETAIALCNEIIELYNADYLRS